VSSAAVGSSARSRAGPQTRAIAIITCRNVPLAGQLVGEGGVGFGRRADPDLMEGFERAVSGLAAASHAVDAQDLLDLRPHAGGGTEDCQRLLKDHGYLGAANPAQVTLRKLQ
jgi:hypothetical protein